jgi:hypothetical protein
MTTRHIDEFATDAPEQRSFNGWPKPLLGKLSEGSSACRVCGRAVATPGWAEDGGTPLSECSNCGSDLAAWCRVVRQEDAPAVVAALRVLGYEGTPSLDLLDAAGLPHRLPADHPARDLLFGLWAAHRWGDWKLSNRQPIVGQEQGSFELRIRRDWAAKQDAARLISTGTVPFGHVSRRVVGRLRESVEQQRTGSVVYTAQQAARELLPALGHAEHVVDEGCACCGRKQLKSSHGLSLREVWVAYRPLLSNFVRRLPGDPELPGGAAAGHVGIVLCSSCHNRANKGGGWWAGDQLAERTLPVELTSIRGLHARPGQLASMTFAGATLRHRLGLGPAPTATLGRWQHLGEIELPRFAAEDPLARLRDKSIEVARDAALERAIDGKVAKQGKATAAVRQLVDGLRSEMQAGFDEVGEAYQEATGVAVAAVDALQEIANRTARLEQRPQQQRRR